MARRTVYCGRVSDEYLDQKFVRFGKKNSQLAHK